MMSAHYVWPAHTAASTVSHMLANAYVWLRRAPIAAELLVAIDPRYRGEDGWDLQMAINDATNHVRAGVRVHDLSRFDPLWSRRAIHQKPNHLPIVEVSTLQPTAGRSAQQRAAAALLINYVTNAFEYLTAAAGAAERLVAYDDEHSGCFGAIGWDLGIAIDDAMIALRDTMRIGQLAQLSTYWQDKL